MRKRKEEKGRKKGKKINLLDHKKRVLVRPLVVVVGVVDGFGSGEGGPGGRGREREEGEIKKEKQKEKDEENKYLNRKYKEMGGCLNK